MGYAIAIVGFLIFLVGIAASIMILIHAFKADTMQGVLCFCVPCYLLYYAFTKFDHPKKMIIIGVMLGCNIIGSGIMQGGLAMAASSAMEGAMPAGTSLPAGY